MQLRFNFGLLLILCCFQVAAKDSLDNLIKQQKNADESTLRAHKLEKKMFTQMHNVMRLLWVICRRKRIALSLIGLNWKITFWVVSWFLKCKKRLPDVVSVVLVCKKLLLPCRIIILMPDISQRELVSLRRIFLKASYVSVLMPGR